jgi:hypothetical protein
MAQSSPAEIWQEVDRDHAKMQQDARQVISDARETLALAMELPLENAHQIDQLNDLIDEAQELVR